MPRRNRATRHAKRTKAPQVPASVPRPPRPRVSTVRVDAILTETPAQEDR